MKIIINPTSPYTKQIIKWILSSVERVEIHITEKLPKNILDLLLNNKSKI